MNMRKNHKKKLIVSYKNLSDELLALFKEAYPEGHSDFVQKTIKPNGEPIFVVPLETEDATYMVKVEVKIDTTLAEEELDKDLYGDDSDSDKSDDVEFAPMSEALEKEEGIVGSRNDRVLKHGDYDGVFSPDEPSPKRGRNAHSSAGEEIMQEFDSFDDDLNDGYSDDRYDDEPDDFQDDEPSDAELNDIDLGDFNDIPVVAETKQPSKRGRKKSTATDAGEAKPKKTRATAVKKTAKQK